MSWQTQTQTEEQLERIAENVVAHEEAVQDAVVRLKAHLESSANLSTAIEYIIELLDGRLAPNRAYEINDFYWWVGHRQKHFYSRKRKVLMYAHSEKRTGGTYSSSAGVVIDPKNRTGAWFIFQQSLPKLVEELTF